MASSSNHFTGYRSVKPMDPIRKSMLLKEYKMNVAREQIFKLHDRVELLQTFVVLRVRELTTKLGPQQVFLIQTTNENGESDRFEVWGVAGLRPLCSGSLGAAFDDGCRFTMRLMDVNDKGHCTIDLLDIERV